MHAIAILKNWLHHPHFVPLELVGIITLFGFYAGRMLNRWKTPAILGYMLTGVLLGPSFLNWIHGATQEHLRFIPEMALGFVALSIGLELNFNSLRKLGSGIISVILFESFGAFLLVFLAVYLLTGNTALALIFGSIAPASAPAGTVAVIQETRARGPLTKALYAVVGFDDGLGIVIFGFASSIARNLLAHQSGNGNVAILSLMMEPLKEIVLSLFVGVLFGAVFIYLAKRLSVKTHLFIVTFGFVLMITGLCGQFHLSYILTNMVFGIAIVHLLDHATVHKIEDELRSVMPLLFILFFTLAGSALHLKSLASLGMLGAVYIVSRSLGLIGGSSLGAALGKMESRHRKYLGLGILSQAGVAIGLSLIVKQDFAGLGKSAGVIDGTPVTTGDQLGITVITTITATCIFFEMIGPVLTRIALQKAGEIPEQ
jgi:Kef-type K+ transport system membrane component KefB